MNKSTGKIIICDDDLEIVQMLRLFLEDQGHLVKTASSGIEALRLLTHFHADVVLSDMVMPELNGLDLLKRIQKLPNPPLFLLMTAHPSIDSAIQILTSGADDYITKPVDLIDLDIQVTRLLDARREAHEEDTRFVLEAAQFARKCGQVEDATHLLLDWAGTLKALLPIDTVRFQFSANRFRAPLQRLAREVEGQEEFEEPFRLVIGGTLDKSFHQYELLTLGKTVGWIEYKPTHSVLTTMEFQRMDVLCGIAVQSLITFLEMEVEEDQQVHKFFGGDDINFNPSFKESPEEKDMQLWAFTLAEGFGLSSSQANRVVKTLAFIQDETRDDLAPEIETILSELKNVETLKTFDQTGTEAAFILLLGNWMEQMTHQQVLQNSPTAALLLLDQMSIPPAFEPLRKAGRRFLLSHREEFGKLFAMAPANKPV